MFYRQMASFSNIAYVSSLNSTYIGNPALAGAQVGAIAFALLTAMELDRAQRSGVDILVDSVTSPMANGFARTVAIMLTALIVQALTLVVWLPVAIVKTGAIFRLDLYLVTYLYIMLPALLMGVLMASAAYQVTHRLDLTLVSVAAMVLVSMQLWSEEWLLRWVNPALHYLTDDFGNQRRLSAVLYNRLFWLLLLGGVWTFSFMCIRRYGKGLIGSFLRSLRKVFLPVLAVMLVGSACTIYMMQPFLDHSGYTAPSGAEDTNGLLLASVHVDARPDLSSGCHWGTATYNIINTTGQPQTLPLKLNPGYSFEMVTANSRQAAWRDLADDTTNDKTMEVDLPADRDIELVVEYGGFPQEWDILSTIQGDIEVSPQSIFLAHSDMLPLARGMEYTDGGSGSLTAEITLPKGMVPVVLQGQAEKGAVGADGGTQWRLSKNGHSMILCAGDYIFSRVQAGGIDVDFYYSAKHERVMKKCKVDEVIKQVFDYCTQKYGPLPFGGGEAMQLVEIGGIGYGFADDGVSAMGEDSFNEQGLRNPLKGAGGSEVLAHEIAHQWWGLGQMVADDSNGAWSSEGLTVYTTYRLMKQLHGEDYVKEHYIDKWQAEVDDYYKNFYVRNPQYMEGLSQKQRDRIAADMAQARHYCEMPLKILKAEQLVGGEEKMDEILRKLFSQESTMMNQYLTYHSFLDACGLTEEDLDVA